MQKQCRAKYLSHQQTLENPDKVNQKLDDADIRARRDQFITNLQTSTFSVRIHEKVKYKSVLFFFALFP